MRMGSILPGHSRTSFPFFLASSYIEEQSRNGIVPSKPDCLCDSTSHFPEERYTTQFSNSRVKIRHRSLHTKEFYLQFLPCVSQATVCCPSPNWATYKIPCLGQSQSRKCRNKASQPTWQEFPKSPSIKIVSDFFFFLAQCKLLPRVYELLGWNSSTRKKNWM